MTVLPVVDALPEARRHAIVTSLSSDAHTWNLVYLELLLEELGCRVTNLGACVPDETIVEACAADRPDLLVVSSLNGHGHRDGLRLIEALRARPELSGLQAVIGGKLDVVGGDEFNVRRLLAAGFDAVFADGAGMNRFRAFVGTLEQRRDPAPLTVG
jgi:methylaspartate mutase sigma subunit